MKIIRMRNADGTQYYAGSDCWTSDRSEAERFHDEVADMKAHTIRCGPTYGVGDYGVHGVVPVDAPLFDVITQSCVEDEDGETLWIVAKTYGDDHKALGDAIKAAYPVERCQHEYDCCGRLYSRGATWSRTDWNIVLIRQNFIRNI
jgi:hypothetical protein